MAINIKKQFSDLRKNTPKHVQWLLLVAAFVVVLILMTLLLTGKDEDAIENQDEIAIGLNIFPDTVEWPSVVVGDKESQTIKVSATAPAKIVDIYPRDEIDGLVWSQQTCTTMGQIDENVSCSIVLEYAPNVASATTTTEIYIDWRGINEPDAMKQTDKIIVVLGATAPEIPEPAPVIPADTSDDAVDDMDIIDDASDADVVENITDETTDITSGIQADMDLLMPDPIDILNPGTTSVATTFDGSDTPEYVRPPESCSDFAMPAYNLSGVQSGWIRPSGGAYYYHPFSDTTCSNPTGTYNPDNGIITDINNPGQKIGTDADHIGYVAIQNGALPQLSNPVSTGTSSGGRARQATDKELGLDGAISPIPADTNKVVGLNLRDAPAPSVIVGTSGTAVFSSDPFDRKFVLRQYKPIPATIVSEVRADPQIYTNGQPLPVRATVDRNVYSDDGRTVVIPTGTLMLGYVTGDLPGPYQTIGRMEIKWYQFILPSGVEFNFSTSNAPFSGDSQGRAGVPGHGSTDYVEQLVMPMLTAIVPAAVNMIAPIADTFVNQIDLDNNTVVQSGTVRSSELAKNEIITAWNQVAQKLLVDAMDNTVPPFSIAAGTRITVYSPTDLVITCGHGDKECSVDKVQAATGLASADTKRNTRQDDWQSQRPNINYDDPSWVGQVRSFDLRNFCTNQTADGLWDINEDLMDDIMASGYDYRTVLAYCQSMNYQAISNAQQDALYQDQQKQFQTNYGTSTNQTEQQYQAYNEDILGLTYDDSGAIQNPFNSTTVEEETTTEAVITCEGGALPDEYGCCPGEIYTDMGEQGFNCCPETGGDCFPPIL